MLYFDRTDVSECTDVNNTLASKEGIICHYWYFVGKGSMFHPDVCNRCYDVLMMFFNLNDIAYLSIHGVNIVVLLMTFAKVKLKSYSKL